MTCDIGYRVHRGYATAFMEERMKALSELAAVYEKWAKANEATAKEMLACLDSFAGEIRDQQRWRANQLIAETAALKKRAAEIRKLEGGMVEIVQDGYKVPQDRDQCCDGQEAIWRYKRFR
jgi:hypothetical protein